MKRILAPILLLVLLFPAVALGQTLYDWVGKGKGLLCKTTGVGCPESVDTKDLVERKGVYFKKFSDVPFTGKSTGKEQGALKNGKRQGPWDYYWANGQLGSEGTYKNGRKEGPWVWYLENGQLDHEEIYKDGKKDGPEVWYHENGQLKSAGTNKDGKKDGLWVWYNANGQLDFEGTYKDGVKISD